MHQQRILVARELRYRNGWLIRLRYLALAGMIASLAVAWRLGLTLDWRTTAIVVGAIFAYNVALHLVYARGRIRDWMSTGYTMAAAQVGFDLLALTALVHGTGGIQTPLVFFYVFHGIIAAILLSRRAAYAQATLAVGLLVGLAVFEHTGLLPIEPAFWSGLLSVGGVAPGEAWVADIRDSAVVVAVIATTLYASVYMTFSLSRELRTREEYLRAANERLREQDRLRSDYVRLIAHDLKDPLAGIQSTLRVLLGGYAGTLDDRQRQLVARAEDRTGQLIGLIGALLDLTRIRALADMERSRWSFGAMLRGVAEQLAAVAEARDLALTLDLPEQDPPVHANRSVVEQVFLNLVGNAVKYTPAGGHVSVRLRDRGPYLEVTVGDDGIGIPAEALPRIFEEFYRAPNAKRQTRDGTGLGLALVREIVKAYGGTIRAESPWRPAADGSRPGTLVTVRLPWSHLAEEESQRAARSSGARGREAERDDAAAGRDVAAVGRGDDVREPTAPPGAARALQGGGR